MVPGACHWPIGDPNVDFCFLCNDGGSLLGCRTCKRSYHRSCLDSPPSQSIYNDAFYCPTCTKRGWHEEPPSDTLPLARDDVEGTRDFRKRSRDVSGVPTVVPSPGDSWLHGREAPTRTFQRLPMTFAETSEGMQVTKPKQGKRRSRYQTVSDEVDAAMITIYRELGNTSELRSELSRMRHQVAKLEQENQIQQGKVELMRGRPNCEKQCRNHLA